MSHAIIDGRLFDASDFASLADGDVTLATSTQIRFSAPATATSAALSMTLTGAGFTYSADDIIGGTVTGIEIQVNGQVLVHIDSFSLPVTQLAAMDSNTLLDFLFGGPDSIEGYGMLQGFAGADSISVLGSGATSVFGGLGDDRISVAAAGSNYLRGDEGNDSITGGGGFDDINGNMGNDTAHGGLGVDWVVGGKDQDMLFGDAGDDIVYGNLGEDTCDGGDGADLIRGGQGNDVLVGGAGNDWLSGDRGDDTVAGGTGADIFHTFGDAGLDRVSDFNAAEGDRVQLDPGTAYTVAQVGADTVVSMTGGGQMVLAGVQLAGLPAGWIFGA
jgi:Ca2+-binding RTX toxin-like protein